MVGGRRIVIRGVEQNVKNAKHELMREIQLVSQMENKK
jgi:hypothetical protein